MASHRGILLALALAAFVLAAQQPAPPGPGGAPGPTTGPTPGPNTPSPTSPIPGRQPGQPQVGDPSQRSQFPEMVRPIFLSGKVVMEDGAPPPEPVTIERVCHGNVRPEGYTDSRGRFSFQLGQNAHLMPDASVSSSSDAGFGGPEFGAGRTASRGGMFGRGGLSERDLIGCELRAALPGFRSEVVNLSGRRVMDNPDVGTIILRRLGHVEGLTISATSLQAPKDAKKAFEKGSEMAKKNKVAEAQKELEKAVQIYPRYAVAWHQLGLAYEKQNQAEQARKAYTESINADSKFVNPYLQLALMAAKENKWQEVADTTDRVVRMNPVDFPQAFFYNSVANLNLQKLDAAEKSAREALKLDSQHRFPKYEHVLGVILANKRDYAGAAEHMRSYLTLAPLSPDADVVRKQLGEIDRILGKTDAAQKQPPQP